MSDRRRLTREGAVWLLLVAALAGMLLLARRDRADRPNPLLAIDRRTVRLPVIEPPAGLPPAPAEVREAAAELERAAEAADEARVKLEQTQGELERTKESLTQKQQDLERLRVDADADTAATKRQLDEARAELEAKREELAQAARDAEERVAQARRDLEDLEKSRLAAAAQAGIAQGFGRGKGFEMKVAADPRRVRNPALQPFVPNDAAVAAAAAAGNRGRGGGSGGQFPGSTVEGDILRGQAARIDAQGQYALDTSAAAINAQTARAMSLDNRIRTVETFFEARRINRINRAFEAGPMITSEQAVKLAAMGLPPRPSSLELDRATGDIGWPRMLTDSAYRDLTSRIQQRFHDRLELGGSYDLAAANDCMAAFDALEARLRANVTKYPAGQYGRAATFLEGLRREYDLPLDD